MKRSQLELIGLSSRYVKDLDSPSSQLKRLLRINYDCTAKKHPFCAQGLLSLSNKPTDLITYAPHIRDSKTPSHNEPVCWFK
ncbi:hypothetical protein LZ554_002312 [Drepanopeziza brunnea f. sp. 'monogermtubi']|nr:hypothetical protein LZ554_002312 [Drepanopeziza brunnea f. sp. 'monogermtubi']